MSTHPIISTPGELLRAALVKEQQAHDYYEHAIQQCRIKMVQELLEKLKDEERRHVQMIRDMIAKIEMG